MLLSYKEIHSRKGLWCSVKKKKKKCILTLCVTLLSVYLYK